MELKLKKQPQKYLAAADEATRKNSTRHWINLPVWKATSSPLPVKKTVTAIKSPITA